MISINNISKFSIPFLIVFLFSCSPNQDNGFINQGNIEGIKDGKAILSKLDLDTNEKVNANYLKSKITHVQKTLIFTTNNNYILSDSV